jgi:hypothetical protein
MYQSHFNLKIRPSGKSPDCPGIFRAVSSGCVQPAERETQQAGITGLFSDDAICWASSATR